MTNKYYKSISIIEAVYLEEKEVLIKRDFSNYYDWNIQIGDKSLEEIINWEEEKTPEFVDFLHNNLDKQYDLYSDFSLNQEDSSLSERSFQLDNKIDFWKFCKKLFDDFYRFRKKPESWFEEDINLIIKGKNKDLEVEKKFNSINFFSNNYILFDIENDFAKKEKLSKWNKLIKTNELSEKDVSVRNLDYMIQNGQIKSKNIYRTQIDLPKKVENKDENDMKKETEKYNSFMFVRNNYLIINNFWNG